MHKKIVGLAEHYRNETVCFVQKMIRTPSLPGEEGEMAAVYLAELKRLGYDEYFVDDWGNVIGIVRGNLPGPTIMFNGHLDQVDIGEIEGWKEYLPYSGEILTSATYNQLNDYLEDTEIICGRGASDCKGGLASQVYGGVVIKNLRDSGMKINGNYMVTAVVMEELGDQIGMIKMLEETFPSRNLEFDAAISAETTSLKIHLGHRGRVGLLITVEGKTAHASSPWLGINAINNACELIKRIENINQKGLIDKQLGNSSISLTNIRCSPGMDGVVPDRCYLHYDRRFNSKETVESCLDEINEIIGDIKSKNEEFNAKVEVEEVKRTSYTGKESVSHCVKQSWVLEDNHKFVREVGLGLEAVGQNVEHGYWGFGTDMAVIFSKCKKPTIGYSPGQEFYISRPVDRVRIDYLIEAVAGNASIFLQLSKAPKSTFVL